MNRPLQLAISTCPNDTFAFHALMHDRIDRRGLEFEILLDDVQQLNDGLFRGAYDVAKASMIAALRMSDELVLLNAGSAIGFGVGPLLLSSQPDRSPRQAGEKEFRVLCPGADTTATLLYRLFYPDCGRIEHVVFSEIMPALRLGQADFGVCIHEGRFTWQTQKLALVADLGERWEEATGGPLPLGGIVARRALGANTLATVDRVIRDSLEYGLAHRQETLPTMRRYAQELDDDVLQSHVDLYVNQWTLELGRVGRDAIKNLQRRARDVGAIGSDRPALEIVGG